MTDQPPPTNPEKRPVWLRPETPEPAPAEATPANHAQAVSDHNQAVDDHVALPRPGPPRPQAIIAIVAAVALAFGLGLGVDHLNGGGGGPALHIAAGTRDPYLQPFTSTSIWNQPIGASAVYVASGIKAPTIRALTTDAAITIQDPSAPATAVLQNGGQHSNTCTGTGTLAQDPIPAALVVPTSSHNSEYAVVQADGQTLDEGGAFARCSAGGPATAGHLVTYGTLYGDGLTGGSGGSRLSTLGGTLRPGELAPSKVEVPHALRVNVDCGADCTPTSPGFRWPATKKDSYSYVPGGSNPKLSMGALLAIPPAFNCASLQAAGAELCKTLQDYGAYIANDSARSVFTITTEAGDADTAAAFQASWGFPMATAGATGAGWADDVQTIIKNLDVVDNNGPNSIGGGGAPRQPLAAPLATSCLTAAALPGVDQTGTVVSVQAGPPTTFTVALASGTISGVISLASATPLAGQTVLVDLIAGGYVILGILPTPATPTPAPTPTPTPLPTATPTPTAAPTPTPTPAPTPTSACPPTGTPTVAPTPTPSSSATATATVPPTPSPTPVSGTPHVLVVMEENKGYAATLGACSADPYLCSLAAQNASGTNWHGVAHPSEPNYYAFISGSTQGCTSDTCGPFAAPSLGSQLDAAHLPWTAWMESMPSACDRSNAGGYVLKHDSFASSSAITDCSAHVLPYPGAGGMVAALDGPTAPAFAWITPNLTNDMHDGSVQQGDAWLKANLAPVLTSTWFLNSPSTVIVTMDEGDPGSTNQIPMVVISSNAAGKGAIATSGNHYGLLRTIEETYGLGLLGGAASASNGDLTALFG